MKKQKKLVELQRKTLEKVVLSTLIKSKEARDKRKIDKNSKANNNPIGVKESQVGFLPSLTI